MSEEPKLKDGVTKADVDRCQEFAYDLLALGAKYKDDRFMGPAVESLKELAGEAEAAVAEARKILKA
jgi:hypothetical protein